MSDHEERKRQRLCNKTMRRRIYSKTNGRCAYCGCELQFDNFTIDHIKAFVQGGTDDESNLFAACRSCNHRKGTSDIEGFRKQIEQFPLVLNRDSVTYKNAVRYGLVIPNPHKVRFYFEELGDGKI